LQHYCTLAACQAVVCGTMWLQPLVSCLVIEHASADVRVLLIVNNALNLWA